MGVVILQIFCAYSGFGAAIRKKSESNFLYINMRAITSPDASLPHKPKKQARLWI